MKTKRSQMTKQVKRLSEETSFEWPEKIDAV